ncbi:MAG: TonB-dependent receptor [Cyclobacteriaceae bacterium]
MKKSRLKNGSDCVLPFYSVKTLPVKLTMMWLLISLAVFQLPAKDYLDLDSKISLVKESASIKQILKEVERQTEFRFFYNHQQVDVNKSISVNLREVTINQALKEIFKSTSIAYKVSGNQILLFKGGLTLAEPNSEGLPTNAIDEVKAPIAEFSVSGTVTDEKSEVLPGVNIIERGTNNGTTTDASGRFSLTVANEESLLVFSFIGYESMEVLVGGKSVIDVSLLSSVSALEEVVVTGYATQKVKDITGAVGVVSMEAFKSIPTASAVQALQGQVSGVTVISSGAPGGRNDIFVRGVTSFGNAQPLILVDGVQVQGGLNDINMNDIESIQVLKDAGAASIYGVRGSNGVVVVTTKSGKSGRPIVSYDGYYGTQIPAKGNVFDLLNSEDYATLFKQVNPGTILFANGLPDYTFAGPNGAGTAMAGDPAIDGSRYNFDEANPKNDYLIQQVNKSGTDWFHEVFKPAPMQSHNLTVSGGTDKSSYLFSLGYLNQQGTLLETYLKRYSLRVNTKYNLSKKIRVGQNAFFFYKENPGFTNQSEGNAISVSYRILPIIPVHDIRGNYGGTWLGPELGTTGNPVAMQERRRQNSNSYFDLIGNVFGEVDILKHLTFRTSFGGVIDTRYYYNFNFNQYNDKESHLSANGFNENAQYNTSYTWTNSLNYNNTFGKHALTAFVGSEAVRYSGRGVGGAANNFFSTDPDYLYLNNGTSNVTNYSNGYENRLFSLFSRLDYAYNDKYLVGVTIRRDGSSLFGSENSHGVFPSFSLGWRIINEGFMKRQTFFDDLKFRGSYGILGSQANVNAANAFTTYDSGFGTSYYDITGTGSTVQGFFQSRNGNRDTGWEENIITNIGVDAAILQSKLDVHIEWYKKSIDGLLFPQPLPATAGGASSPTINIGDIQNQGWDISAVYRGKIASDLTFRLGANITTYKNEVVSIPDPGYFDVSGSRIGNTVRNQEGHPVGSFFGYEVQELFSDDADVAASPTQTDAAPGRFKYRDINGDNAITPGDRTFFGDPNPDFTYGLNIGINYKNFDFSAIFYGSQGNDVINFVRYYTDFFGTSEGKGKSNRLKSAWTSENLNATTPIAEYASTFSTNGAFNSYLMEDGSFLKLRSMVLGYNISPSVLSKFGASRCRLYVQAANLFTITKYTGLDPELPGSLDGTQSSASFGIDKGNYPNNQKSFLIGANISF